MSSNLISGWQITGILTLQDGQPFSVSNASGATPKGLSNLGYSEDPNVNTAFTGQVILGGPNQYFNPAAFYYPQDSELQTAKDFQLGNVGRNTLIGPGLANWDFSLNKNSSITERWKMQFRAEFFNLLNRPNFAKPSASIFTTGGKPLASAGRISRTVGSPREIQFGLRFMF